MIHLFKKLEEYSYTNCWIHSLKKIKYQVLKPDWFNFCRLDGVLGSLEHYYSQLCEYKDTEMYNHVPSDLPMVLVVYRFINNNTGCTYLHKLYMNWTIPSQFIFVYQMNTAMDAHSYICVYWADVHRFLTVTVILWCTLHYRTIHIFVNHTSKNVWHYELHVWTHTNASRFICDHREFLECTGTLRSEWNFPL